MAKSKVKSMTPWGDTDKYGNQNYNIEFEDGTKGNYKGNPNKRLSFTVGEEAEYVTEEATWGKSGKAYTKVKPPQKEFTGGKKYTPKMMTYKEVGEYCKKNARRACCIVDHIWQQKVLREKTVHANNVREIAAFILGDIRGDIELWGDKRNGLDDRRDAILSAAEVTHSEKYKKAGDLIKIAEYELTV